MKRRIHLIGLLVAVLMLASCSRHYTLGTVDFDYMPFIYTDEDQQKVRGICIDLLDAIAQEQGFTYDLQEMSITETFKALKGKRIQASIAPFTITEDKKVTYDFSLPVYETGIVFVKSQDNLSVHSLQDIVGKSVAVMEHSSMEQVLREYKDVWKIGSIRTFQTSDEVSEALFYNKVDLAFMEKPMIDYNIAQGLMFERSKEVFERSKYAFLFLKNENREVYEDINVGLAKIINNGTYNRIISKYYL